MEAVPAGRITSPISATHRHLAMQYLLLVYTDAELLDKLPEEEFNTEMRGCLQQADARMAQGKVLGFQQLQPAATARTVRSRNGRAAVLGLDPILFRYEGPVWADVDGATARRDDGRGSCSSCV
jgi:hypothetical protein